jgi:glycosyltransferase involved in cell wall biosynthesis
MPEGSECVRVLVATHSAEILGGTESYLSEVLPLLAESGFDVGLVTEVQTQQARSLRAPEKRWNWTITGAGQARALIDTWLPDVVMQNGMSDSSLEGALIERVPGVLFAHSYYGTCVSGTKRFAQPRLKACHRRFGVACLGLYLPRRCGGLSPAKALQRFTLQRRRLLLSEGYRCIIVASEAMRQEYLRHEVVEERLRVLPYFVAADVDGRGNAPTQRRDRHGPVLMISRLVPEKGARQLIEAAASAQSVLGWRLRLMFAGTGSIEPLRQLAQRRCVTANFLGWVSVEKRLQLITEASLLAVPSVWPEPFGIVGIEGGIQGLPAVGFATGGIVDWLVDGESGVSAPGETPRASDLAAALIRALESEARYQTLCTGAARNAKRFTASRHLSGLSAALEFAVRRR